jgi:hypothetical protein
MLQGIKTLQRDHIIGVRVPTVMITKSRRVTADIESDPFGERIAAKSVRTGLQLMGGRFHFHSNSLELLHLVDAAYAGLPPHRFSANAPEFSVKLLLTPCPRRVGRGRPVRAQSEPPRISMLGGPDLLGAATESSTFVVLSPRQRCALVSVSRDMLRFPYHIRYEVIEFAVFALASRAQRLAPLHAACVGLNGRGILLMGPSGSGKSTVALHSLLNGFDFLSEDSVFVAPKSMRATGVANFLHVRTDSLSWLGPAPASALIRKSPIIRRRSGVEKFELDLRSGKFHLAKAPLKIVGVAFLSSRTAAKGLLLRPLSEAETLARLKREQAYGASQPEWHAFSRNLLRLGGVEILRGSSPATSVELLRSLILNGIAKFPRLPT